MAHEIEQSELDAALRRCGSSWNASQAHGLICSRLALQGADALDNCLRQVLEGPDGTSALQKECADQLRELHDDTWRQLAERGSEFRLLLPDEAASPARRTEAMAQWCEGFLHGLVVRVQGDRLRKRLASEPLSELIKDLVEISRAEVDDSSDEETNEAAFVELQEYLRVAAQFVYEELAEFRRPASAALAGDSPSGHLH